MTKRGNIMTTTANNSESKVLVNGIGFSGWFYKFLREEIKIGNQILYPGSYQSIKKHTDIKNKISSI